MIQIYKWCNPRESMRTMYGRITCSEWLKKEKARIESKPGRVANVIEDTKGRVSLEVNQVAGA